MGVVKIEPNNYKEGLRVIRKINCVVLVFHPQCGHCIQMRPNWEAMKSMVHPNVKIVELNGEGMGRSPELSNSPVGRGTEGFPSLLRFKRGKLVEKYDGERSPEKMAHFVNQAIEPPRRIRSSGKSKARSKSRSKPRANTKKLRRKN